MAAAKYLELAVILKAVDQMSGVAATALGRTQAGYNSLQNSQERANASMSKGLKLGAGAKVAIDALASLTKKYGNLQEADEDLRISMMRPGAKIDEQTVDRLERLGETLSKSFGGSQMDYLDMVRAMKENRLEPQDILGGIGKADAELSELFRTIPAEAAVFTARLKNDMKVPAEEMIRMVDLAARLKQVGVGHTGSETIANLTEFYSKAGLGATNLGLKGTHDAMELGALGAMFIAKGQDAPSVGTTFRRIFDNIANPKKFKEMNEAAAEFHQHLEFFDKAGHFKGIGNFVAQLDKLHQAGLTTQQISGILGPIGSQQGMSGDVLKSIAEFGKQDYLDFLDRIASQGTITDKVAEYQKGLNAQLNITSTDLENLKASIGKSYNPIVMKATKITQGFLDALTEFSANHQTATGIMAGMAGLAAGGMAIGAAFNFMKTAWVYSGMAKFGTWAMGGIDVAGIFSNIAMNIGAIGLAAADVAVPLLLLYSILKEPEKWWAGIKNFGSGVAMPFMDAAHAIKSEYDYLINGKADDVPHKKLPAKINWDELNDALHKGGKKPEPKKLPNPMVSDWKPGDMQKQMHIELAKTSGYFAGKPITHTTINYSPTVNIQGDADKKTIKNMLNDHKNELMNVFRKHQADSLRTAF
jgi:TP901 family phage tail tape measure protein